MGIIHKLRELGICGVNERSTSLIFPHNRRRFYPRVDNKVLTKEIALRFQVPVPKLYGVVQFHHELRHLDQMIAPYARFVIKPARGAQGKGIVLIAGRDGDAYIQTDGQRLTLKELRYYVSGILSGLYSLGGQVDQAIIEYMLESDPFFQSISSGGVPDIRIIVYKGVPIMAMVRLPTRESHGKANLHQGAVGMGVHISTGVSTHAVYKNRSVTHHPDTGTALTGLQLPAWDQMLEMAAHAFEMTELGYVGVDIAMDKDQGPMILELNARPGLSIQIANRAGLLRRTAAVDHFVLDGKSPAERVGLVKDALQDL
jgi:alpha-L-glutamate ligase-like protein